MPIEYLTFLCFFAGSKLEQEVKEFQDCPVFAYGPLEIGASNPIPLMTPTVPGAMSSGFGGGDYSSQGFPRGQGGGQQGGQFRGGSSFSGGRDGGGRGRGEGLGRGRGDGGRGRGGGSWGAADTGGSYYQQQATPVSVPQVPSSIQGLPSAVGTRKKSRFG